MASKSKQKKEDVREPGGGEPAPAEATATAPCNPNFPDRPDIGERKGKTLYLKLDADNNPEWSRMTPKTLETWGQVFNHPSTASAFSTEPIPPEDKGAKPADVASLLGWMAAGEAMLFSRISGLPLEECADFCKWTAEEKQAIEPRLARLSNKYGGDLLAKYGDEIWLSMTLSQSLFMRYTVISRLARERRAAELAQVEEEKKPPAEVIQ